MCRVYLHAVKARLVGKLSAKDKAVDNTLNVFHRHFSWLLEEESVKQFRRKIGPWNITSNTNGTRGNRTRRQSRPNNVAELAAWVAELHYSQRVRAGVNGFGKPNERRQRVVRDVVRKHDVTPQAQLVLGDLDISCQDNAVSWRAFGPGFIEGKVVFVWRTAEVVCQVFIEGNLKIREYLENYGEIRLNLC